MKILKSEVCNGSSIRSQIITDDCKRSTSLDNHVGDTNSAEGVNRQATSGALNTEDLALAVLRSRECRAVSAVVIEEAVQTSTIDDDVFAVEHTETEGVAVTREAGAVVGVVEGGVRWVGAVGSIGVRLVVSKRGMLVQFVRSCHAVLIYLRRFCLDEAGDNIASTGELELVEGMVLDTGSVAV